MNGLIVVSFTFAVAVLVTPLNETQPRASCIVNSYDQMSNALSNCITIDGIEVPASTTLDLNLGPLMQLDP
ncbi:hypothetical protein NQ318_018509 [Aromia moschata]|uniref:Uncharacterized protein n=1 Tax=Aromia moschata TaxID=1265417 RepID=A0AAV8ZF55_9CUCU|nr:hypothetical protein NQ318_018509 [Aromia moschata]